MNIEHNIKFFIQKIENNKEIEHISVKDMNKIFFITEIQKRRAVGPENILVEQHVNWCQFNKKVVRMDTKRRIEE